MNLFFRIFEHLLPRSRAWQMKVESYLRSFFMGLVGLPSDSRDFIDQRYLDTQPQDTTQLPEWEEQWALVASGLTDQERRARLDAAWKLKGGQDPRYIQDTLIAHGFDDVFIHEWWEVPAGAPPVARNPNLYLLGGAPVYIVECGEALAECGEALAECGNTLGVLGYPLVNKIVTSEASFVGMGESQLDMGEPTALMGEGETTVFGVVEYSITADPERWPYFLYFAGATFPDGGTVPVLRRVEFEDLLLSICPGHLWLGIMVTYT